MRQVQNLGRSRLSGAMKIINLLRVGMIVMAGFAALWTARDLRQFTQIDPNASVAEISARLDDVLTRSMENYSITGVAAGAIRDGEIIWSARMGRASAEGAPITGSTAFNVGSVSKPLTVWAVLALAQNGSIDLDAPIGRYLEQFALPEGEFDLAEVTIRRLLRHTAGTNRHGYGGYGAHEDQPADAVELSTVFEPLAVIAQPGAQRMYSGGGYVLLQMMIEDVTGLSFEAAVQELVFGPLEMTDSGFVLAQLPNPSATFSYYGRDIEDLRDVALAAAGAYVSGDDMARFLLAHGTGGGVLGAAMLDAAFAPTEPNASFAMSYSRWETPLGLLIGHGGNNSAWNAQIYMRPETKDGFYFLTNSTSGAQLDFELSCAWLSMIDVQEGRDRCAEAISLTHKISWAACGMIVLSMMVLYWLCAGMILGKRSLSIRPRGRGPIWLTLRMMFFVCVAGLLGVAVMVFYTDLLMWRTEVTLIDEMPVNEIGRLLVSTTSLLILLGTALWSSPIRQASDAEAVAS